MAEPALRRTSIRRRLLLFLITSLLFMVAGAAVVTYIVAVHATNDAYDRSLLDPAEDIAANVRVDSSGTHVDLPQLALSALMFDQVDRIVFQVRSAGNEYVDGASELPPPSDVRPGQAVFFDSVYDGEPIRVAAVRTLDGTVVQVGETLNKRNKLMREILFAEVVPTLLVGAVAIALAWFGVKRGLLPLERVRSELMRRSPHDLRPLPETAAPMEIAPVADAFNRLLDRLREAHAMQQRFLANAAHQLRTPLAGLQMHGELLLRRPDLPADARAELERMHTATIRASRLANQLLALAKAESEPRQTPRLELIDLATVADAAARDWAPKALTHKIDLGFCLEPAMIVGDPVLLPELLNNLIDNALRYTPAPGAVTVNTGQQDDMAYLCVEDTGPGIPIEEKHKVVERFYRMPGRTGDGSGLGLAIVKEVVDRHAGVLEIRPRDDEAPFSVRVLFPRAQSVQSQNA